MNPKRWESESSKVNLHVHDFDERNEHLELKSDVEVWRDFKKGDEAAFILIYKRHFGILASYCYQFTQDKDLVKDCIQDLFLYIRDKRETISETNNIKLYLLKSCRHRIIEYIKLDLKIRSLNEHSRHAFVPTPSAEENIIRLESRQVKEKQLKEAMQKLSLKEREILYYFYYQNMDYEAITEILDYKHIKSTRSLLYKAVGKLKELLVSVVLLVILTS